jgi:hypothetical protein
MSFKLNHLDCQEEEMVPPPGYRWNVTRLSRSLESSSDNYFERVASFMCVIYLIWTTD